MLNFFHIQEISFLQRFFHNNGFSRKLFDNQVEKFFSKKLDFRETTLTVPQKPLYSILPYFGHKSVLLVKELSNLITEYFPHTEPKLILVNNNTIGSFFKNKDVLPKSLRSSLVYKFSCPQSNCVSAYVGSTHRYRKTRCCISSNFGVRKKIPICTKWA